MSILSSRRNFLGGIMLLLFQCVRDCGKNREAIFSCILVKVKFSDFKMIIPKIVVDKERIKYLLRRRFHFALAWIITFISMDSVRKHSFLSIISMKRSEKRPALNSE